MSRVAKMPVLVPQGVDLSLSADLISVKGSLGSLVLKPNALVKIEQNDGKLTFAPADDSAAANAMSGTMRQLVNNMVVGVSKGFEKKLTLLGVGYKAQAQGNKLNLTVGYSHPVEMVMPEGVKVETPAPTEVLIKGADRQRVGQIAAEVRAVRPPEPYKGKGIRYADERVTIKETKKK
ncbi:50S ribosomal protein L6 [Burkholderiaceae bacterium]|jgi:large subunit ribosomal protein L6|nr:50S ribosomal protein L6 [Betaproteobacteria bacterium]MDA8599753.1 50S ribosomal protein L6 [Burkholderiaceae bacterium]MCH9846036.1 50S ribosomal protein L6 [Betaproteobacteria bacterium]MDA9076117.1 50S ribosomal protein L6 [Burkholderiaceae bacterium]MDA9884175.1 50S ribosomal protein L6 [Burkholderiaceae bacterium]